MPPPEPSLSAGTNGALAPTEPEPTPQEAPRSQRAPVSNGHESPNLHKYTSGNAFYQWHLRQVMRVLHETLAETAPQSVLDAGCGEGFVTRFLGRREKNWDLTGVDASEGALRYARRHANGRGARYVTGNLYALPFSNDTFDTVLCSEVLEHLGHPGRAFRELQRVARQAIVVSVPREPYFRWLNGVARALGLSPDPGHVNFWTGAGFRRFVHEHLRQPQFRKKHTYQLARGRVPS